MVYGARLESVFTGNRNVGSNPIPSAINFDATASLLKLPHAKAQRAGGFARQAVDWHFFKSATFVSKQPFFSAGC